MEIDIRADPVVQERVKRTTIDTMLAGYKAVGTRFLEDTTYLGRGSFKAHCTVPKHRHYDTAGKLYHLTEAELVLVFNQFSYTAMAHLLETGRIPKLGRVPPEKFVELLLNRSPIRRTNFEYPTGVDLAAVSGRFNAELDINALSYRRKDKSVRAEMRISVNEDALYGTRDQRFLFK